MSKRTLGIDEAGRGPVLGPMVIAAVCLDTAGARALSRRGLRDSKTYGAGSKAKARRLELASEVRERAVYVGVRVIDVCEIDRRVQRNELNALEREVAKELICEAPRRHRIVADGKRLFAQLGDDFDELEALDKAEEKHAAVAAASVIAKTRRDQLMERICARYRCEFGEVEGGGYVNAKTRAFLRAYAERHGRLPPEARWSWPFRYLADILGEDFAPLRAKEAQLALFSD
jgi:ribonuclease HII